MQDKEIAGKVTQTWKECICGAEEANLYKMDTICAAVARTAGEDRTNRQATHAALFAGCVGYAKDSCLTIFL